MLAGTWTGKSACGEATDVAADCRMGEAGGSGRCSGTAPIACGCSSKPFDTGSVDAVKPGGSRSADSCVSCEGSETCVSMKPRSSVAWVSL